MNKIKKILVATAIIMGAWVVAPAQSLVRPEPLKQGDKIAIISPASACKASYVADACEVLRQWGYNPVIGSHALGKHGSFAGTIEERKSDLLKALTDPEIKAILCSRGGYGSVQELCEIDRNIFAKYPKWLIGYSDITALHGAITSQGVMSLHAPMCEHIAKFEGADSCSIVLRNILAGTMPHYKVAADMRNRHGQASGLLLGGNLALLNSFTASPIDMLSCYANRDVILFVEDVGESLERPHQRPDYRVVQRCCLYTRLCPCIRHDRKHSVGLQFPGGIRLPGRTHRCQLPHARRGLGHAHRRCRRCRACFLTLVNIA